MANNTTTQASYIQDEPQADECRENIPPRGPNAIESSKLENAALNETEIFTSELGEDNVNVFDVRVFSTPAPKKIGEGQVKSRLSGVQSALTPILKYPNNENKISSPEPFKHFNSPNLVVPFNFPAANRQKLMGESRKLIGCEDFSMISDECLPEMTLSNLTVDSMMQLTTNDSVLPGSQPATPQLCGKKTHVQTSARRHKRSPPELLLLATDYRSKADESFKSSLSSQGIIDNYLQEITLLDVSRDSELSPVSQMPSMDITPVVSPAGHLKDSRAASDHSEQIMGELSKSDTVTNEESGTSVNSVQCARQSLIKASLEVTQDVTTGSTLDNSRCTSETSGQKVEKSQNSDDGTRVINVTHDLSSSGNTSAQGAGISSSSIERSIPEFYPEPREKPDSVDAEMEAQQARCDTKVSSKRSQQSPESETRGQKMEQCHNSDKDTLCTQAINITHEISTCSDTSAQIAHLSTSDTNKSLPDLESELKKKPDSVDAKTEELPTSCDSKSTSEESQQSLKSDVSANGTFTVEQPSVASALPDNNVPGQVSCPNNETLDLPAANISNPKDVDESSDQQIKSNQSCSGEKERTYSKGQNATFDRDSLQQSKTQISSLEKTPASLGHRNNTFDCKPPSQQNGTMTLSEMSSSNSHQSTLGNASAAKASNSTTTLKEDNSEDHSSKLQRNESSEPDAEKDGSPNMTFEANPAVEPANGSGGCECKDLSQAGLPVTDSLSDLSNHQSSDTITIKAHSFNLDETLDLRAECLTTSTPMPSGKVFLFESKQEAGKVPTAQKKLYGDPPNKPSDTMPSNIVCDPKTFFKQPASKYLYPPSKTTASHLLKINPAAATGLPVRRHRTEGEAVKSAAASEEQQAKASTSTCYNLRSLASKLPTSGLQRPQQSGLPVGLPRAAPGLRTRISTAASSSTEKLCGSTAASGITKHPQGRKHPLTKGEVLPVSKRKKIEALPSSSNTEAPTSACGSSTGVKTLKQPTTSQRSAPDRTPKTDAAVPASAAKTVTCFDASSRGRSLRPPGATQRPHLAKPQSHGCTKCSVLEEKIRLQSEEIQRLKTELLKYETPVDV